jgi:hypothetical protein
MLLTPLSGSCTDFHRLPPIALIPYVMRVTVLPIVVITSPKKNLRVPPMLGKISHWICPVNTRRITEAINVKF